MPYLHILLVDLYTDINYAKVQVYLCVVGANGDAHNPLV